MLMTQRTWTAGEPGDYAVSVAAIYEFDIDPTNNLQQHSFVVTPQSSMLTLAEAAAILNSEVLDDHPRAELLTAVYLSPPANPSDSPLPAGTLVESADSSLILQYEHPAYFFFVDLYLNRLFAHPVRRGEEITILLPRLADRSATIRLHDATGRLTMRLDGFVNGSGMLEMLLPDAVPAGVYLMVVDDGVERRGVRRIVVR